MENIKPGIIFKYLKLLLALTWAIFVFKLLSAPMPSSTVYVFTWYDKFVHTFLFGTMAYLLFDALYSGLNYSFNRTSRVVIIFCTAYIFSSEYLQKFFSGRTPDLYDSLAGLAGVLMVYLYFSVNYQDSKPSLLLHVCCAGCGLPIIEKLSENYRLTLFYYNPNIFPKTEYQKRLQDIIRVSKKLGIELIEIPYDHQVWRKEIKNYEKEPEGAGRCQICYKIRLEKTALYAKNNNYHHYATTLSISPHKDTKTINAIGRSLGKANGIFFLDEDFKKNNGFQQSIEATKKYSVYRQKYCGCEFSQTYKLARKEKPKKITEKI